MKKNKNIPMIIFAIIIVILMAISITGIIDEQIGMCISLFLVIIFTLILAGTAHKSGLFAIEILMFLFMVIGVVLFGLNIYNLIKGDEEYEFQIVVSPNESAKQKFMTYGGYDYYTYNLSSVKVVLSKNDKTYSLDEAFQNNLLDLEKIQSLMVPNEGTVGYKIFYDGGQSKYNNSQYSLVVCENKKEAIFTTYDYVYTEDMCQN